VFLERYEIIFAPERREVTGHEIILAPDSRELSGHGTPMFPCGAYIVDLSRFGGGILPWHWHEEIEVLTLRSGAARIGLHGMELDLKKGEGVFVNSNVLHSAEIVGGDGCVLNALVFHPEIVSGAAGSVFQQRYVRPLISCGSLTGIPLRSENAWEREALEAFKKAHDACGAEKFGYEFAVREGLSRVCLLIVQNMRAALEREKLEQPANTGRIKAMLDYLHRHYREPLTLRDIAATANVSERECLRCFAEAIGTPPMRYLLKYRVSISAHLLAETNTPIAEICGLTGFDDPSYFSKSFKRFIGITPSGYRKKYGADIRE